MTANPGPKIDSEGNLKVLITMNIAINQIFTNLSVMDSVTRGNFNESPTDFQ